MLFFGHRKTNTTPELKNKIRQSVENLIINRDVSIFLFGSKSEFDELCYEVITETKEKYPYIVRVCVRAEYPYIDIDYKNYILQRYEYTYFPPQILNAGKAAYIKRNYEMIDKSSYSVIYYNKSYVPKTHNNHLINYKPKSGTGLAYEYAKRKGLHIINLF